RKLAGTHALADVRWRLYRFGLGGPSLLALDFALGRRTLLNIEQRLSAHAIEHEGEAGLGHLRHGCDGLAAARDRYQVGLRGKIVIPKIVMHGLEMPEALSRRGIERDQRIAETIRALAISAVEVHRRRGQGKKH